MAAVTVASQERGRLTRVFLAVFVALAAIVVLIPAPGAGAQDGADNCVNGDLSGNRFDGICAQVLTDDEVDELNTAGSDLLPGQRWLDGYGVFHTRYDADAWNDLPRKSAAGMNSIMFSFGQFLTGTRSNMTMWAMYSRSSFLDSTDKIDDVWTAVGDAVWDSGIFLLAILGAVLTAAWSWMWRNRMQSFRAVLKDVVVALVVFWAFALLLGQARSDGPLSPGHLTQQLVVGVDSLAAAPAAGLATTFTDDLDFQESTGSALSCDQIIDGMRADFAESGRSVAGADAIEPVALLVDDQLTISTIGKAWSLAQGGDTSMFNARSCLLLEWNSRSASAADMRAFFSQYDARWGAVPVEAFNMRDGQKQDVRFIAWMACSTGVDGTPYLSPRWYQLAVNGGGVTVEDREDYEDGIEPDDLHDYGQACTDFIGDNDDGGSGGGGPFDFEEGNFPNQVDSAQVSAAGVQDVVDSVHSWQGYRQGNTLAGGIVAVVTALMLLVVVAFATLGTIFAGVFLIVLVPIGGPVVLAAAAFPGKSSMARKFGKRVLFAAAARALFILQLSMLAAIGAGILALFPAPDGTWGVLWHGIAWIGAGLAIHTAAKKMGAPSVISPSGAFAFAAGSVAGGAVMYGATRNAPRRGKQMVRERRQNLHYRNSRKRGLDKERQRRVQNGEKPMMRDRLNPFRRNQPPNGQPGGKPAAAAATGAAAGAAAGKGGHRPISEGQAANMAEPRVSWRNADYQLHAGRWHVVGKDGSFEDLTNDHEAALRRAFRNDEVTASRRVTDPTGAHDKKPSVFNRASRRAAGSHHAHAGGAKDRAQQARQDERERRRSLRQQQRDEQTQRRDVAANSRREQVQTGRADREEKRHDLNDAKWERRQTRIQTAIEGASDRLRGTKTDESVEERRQRREAASASVKERRSDLWRARDDALGASFDRFSDELGRKIDTGSRNIDSAAKRATNRQPRRSQIDDSFGDKIEEVARPRRQIDPTIADKIDDMLNKRRGPGAGPDRRDDR